MLRTLLAVALIVSHAVLLSIQLRVRMLEASRLEEAVTAWEQADLPTTLAWRVHVYLSRLHWLGPLRPRAPPSPLEACGIGTQRNRWVLVLRAGKTRQQARCLREHIKMAREAHSAFRSEIQTLAVAALCLAAFVIAVQATRRQRRPAHLVEDDTQSYSCEESSNSSSILAQEPQHDEGEASCGSAPNHKAPEAQLSTCKYEEAWTGQEKGTTVVEVPLGPLGSVFAEVTDAPPAMTEAALQCATAEMARLLRARTDQTVAPGVQFGYVAQLIHDHWLNSTAAETGTLDQDSSPELD